MIKLIKCNLLKTRIIRCDNQNIITNKILNKISLPIGNVLHAFLHKPEIYAHLTPKQKSYDSDYPSTQ
jgi:hypothetical protein